MAYKTLIQITLIGFILIGLILFYNTYLKKEKNSLVEIKKENLQKVEETKSNLIYNLDYKSSDIDNNKYTISSKSGVMSEDGLEFLMNEVNAKIILNDQSEVIIFSDKALYNNSNYNTQFYGNVRSIYGVKTIFSQKMDLDFQMGVATIYEDVLLKDLETQIKTDKIEFDLNTKNILLSMDNKEKKVNLTSNF